MMKLYSYFRSSAAYRVRIALHLKALDHEIVPVNLVAGAQHQDAHKKRNPLGRVPVLMHNDLVLTQSLAITEYLDEIAPHPPLISGSAGDKAYIRTLAQIIGCDIHPLTNLNVLQYLTGPLGLAEPDKKQWYEHFALSGLQAFEATLSQSGKAGPYCAGNAPSLADLFLIPQLYNMRRFSICLDHFPLCLQIEQHCIAHKAFQKAAPESQPDAPDDLAPIHGPRSPVLTEADCARNGT